MNTLIVMLVFVLTGSAAKAADVDLVKGQLITHGTYAKQVLAAKNNGGPISRLELKCGFFHGTALLDVGSGFSDNIAAGQTVYVEVVATNAGDADRTDCRVVQ